jgi:hypothetical protein
LIAPSGVRSSWRSVANRSPAGHAG